jgi:hypothetical protein
MPPQSFITVLEIASAPPASRAVTRVLPHTVDRFEVKRAVKEPAAVLVAVLLYVCFVFDTTTLTCESEWNPLPRTTSGDSSAIQTFATVFADAAVGAVTTSAAPRSVSMRRTVMFPGYPIRPRSQRV